MYDAAHAQFVRPALSRSELWRFVLGLALAVLLYVGLTLIYFRAMYQAFGAERVDLHQDFVDGNGSPLAMYLMLFSFGLMTLSVFAIVRFLHRRPILSLFGHAPTMVRQFGKVIAATLLLSLAVLILPPWGVGEPMVANMPAGMWIALLPLSLLAVLTQVSAEEIFFRGYIQQQLAARFKSPLVWMVLPAVLFALGHYLPEEAGDNALVIATWSGLFGLLMADLTARSGTLGPAIAVHFCNNVWALLITSMPDSLSGLSLYLMPFSMADTELMRAWLPVDFGMMVVMWLAARLAIRR